MPIYSYICHQPFISDSLNRLKQTHPNTGKRSLPRNVAVRLLKLPLPWWSRVPQSWTTGELDNLTYTLGGKFHHFVSARKNGGLFHFRWFSGLKILGWKLLGWKKPFSWCRVGTSFFQYPKKRWIVLQCFFTSKPYIYSFNKHQAVKLSLGCICVSLHSVTLLLYPLLL